MADERKNDVFRAKEYCYLLLRYRQRSRKEIEQRLRLKKYSPEIISQVCADLEKQGLLNDAEFVRMWVNSRREIKSLGRGAIQQELRLKGVDEGLIQEALSGINEEAELTLARGLGRKVARRYNGLADLKSRRRFFSYLKRRGFQHGIINKVLKEQSAVDDDYQ